MTRKLPLSIAALSLAVAASAEISQTALESGAKTWNGTLRPLAAALAVNLAPAPIPRQRPNDAGGASTQNTVNGVNYRLNVTAKAGVPGAVRPVYESVNEEEGNDRIPTARCSVTATFPRAVTVTATLVDTASGREIGRVQAAFDLRVSKSVEEVTGDRDPLSDADCRKRLGALTGMTGSLAPGGGDSLEFSVGGGTLRLGLPLNGASVDLADRGGGTFSPTGNLADLLRPRLRAGGRVSWSYERNGATTINDSAIE